jgi:mannose-6-phosphate isomerase
MRPLQLAPNPVGRAYRAGEALAAFRGIDVDESTPEDWLASTVEAADGDSDGLSRLADGRLLRDAIAADPEAFFSRRHLEAFGPDPRLLVKLLDAGVRLPVHFHPDRGAGLTTAGKPASKTEAWVIVGAAEPDAAVYFGFREDVDGAQLAQWATRGPDDELLAAMNRIAVSAGDVVFVPGGVPHSIGAGIFMVELQEPSDAAVFLSDQRFDLPLVVGIDDSFDVALRGADCSPWTDGRLGQVLSNGRDDTSPSIDLLPAAASPYFRARRLRPSGALRLEAEYSVLVVLEGRGRLMSTHDRPLELKAGDTVLVPFGAGDCLLAGDIVVIQTLPPSPEESRAP